MKKKTQGRDGREANVDSNKRECLTSLPGGDQVDGLPPASIRMRGNCAGGQLRTYPEIFMSFSEKVEVLYH